MVVGVLIFWAGFLFYAGPSFYTIFIVRQYGPSKIFENVLLAGSTGGLTALIIKPIFHRSHKRRSYYDCLSVCNGILVGLVSVSAGIDRIEPWAAIILAFIGAIFYSLFCEFLEIMWIDDPLEGSAVHFIGGMWSLIGDGFFDTRRGAFYDDEKKAKFFGLQLGSVVLICFWVGLISMTYFWAMYEFNLLRVS
mmetsp:Transcript_19933/g.18937  ORF Transcript_19933/g.18937 Transcript_19933/m.18937 type:complete len:193 (+) Transcript_19933:755-1333(+)